MIAVALMILLVPFLSIEEPLFSLKEMDFDSNDEDLKELIPDTQFSDSKSISQDDETRVKKAFEYLKTFDYNPSECLDVKSKFDIDGIIYSYKILISFNRAINVEIKEYFDGRIEALSKSNKEMYPLFYSVQSSPTSSYSMVTMNSAMKTFLRDSQPKLEKNLKKSFNKFDPAKEVSTSDNIYYSRVAVASDDNITVSFKKNSNGQFVLDGVKD